MRNQFKARLVTMVVAHFQNDTERISNALAALDHAHVLLSELPDAEPRITMAATAMLEFGAVESIRRHGLSNPQMQSYFGPKAIEKALIETRLNAQARREVSRIVARLHVRPSRPSLEFQITRECYWLVHLAQSPQLLADAQRLRQSISQNFTTEPGTCRAHEILLGENPVFIRMGKVYKLLVDERSRGHREEPLLLELAQAARKDPETGRMRARSRTTMLDLACGTGFHTRLLGRAGYRVQAFDSSPSILTEAKRKKTSRYIKYQVADLLAPLPAETSAALTLLLGNTLSLFTKKREMKRVLLHATAATEPGGYLLCQTLNYQRILLDGPITIVRKGKIDGMETCLTKTTQVVSDGTVLISLMASQYDENSSNWNAFSRASTLIPLSPQKILQHANTCGLVRLQFWGDMKKTPFQEETSTDCVMLFQKPK